MEEKTKTVEETVEMLGVSTTTVYRLLKIGKLQRVGNSISPTDRGGRPVTRISLGSITAYIKNY